MNIIETKDSQFRGDIGGMLDLDIKQLTDQGQFEGYAATYGNIDRGGDICVAGCFDESLRARPIVKVKMLLHHDTRRVVGRWTDAVSDSKGLHVKGQLLLATNDGKETYELLKAEALDGLSIGYRTQESEYDRDEDIRRITKAELMEVSIVTFPMNEQAMVSMVKSFEPAIDAVDTLSDAEKLLREAGRAFSRKEAKDFVSVVRKIAQREAGGDHTADDEVGALNRLSALMRA